MPLMWSVLSYLLCREKGLFVSDLSNSTKSTTNKETAKSSEKDWQWVCWDGKITIFIRKREHNLMMVFLRDNSAIFGSLFLSCQYSSHIRHKPYMIRGTTLLTRIKKSHQTSLILLTTYSLHNYASFH